MTNLRFIGVFMVILTTLSVVQTANYSIVKARIFASSLSTFS